MYSTSDFRRGLKVLYQGEPFEIAEFQHHKPGKGAAIVRTKLKNLVTGLTIDPTFRSGDKLEKPDLEERDVQYLYVLENIYHFMDPKSYDQFEVPASVIGSAKDFFIENMVLELLFFEGKVISLELPNHVALKVVECDPAVKGDTVSGATKPAKVESGYTCQVPLFINEGDKIRIDTRTGDYVERA